MVAASSGSTSRSRIRPVTAWMNKPVTASAPSATHQSGIACTPLSWAIPRLPSSRPATASTQHGRRPRQASKARNSPMADSTAIQTRSASTEVVSRVTGAASTAAPRLCTGGRMTWEACTLVCAM